MDEKLRSAIEKVHKKDGWVHIATVGKNGRAHVAPVMMGVQGDKLLFSFTGMQKKRNMQRDPHCTVSMARDGDYAHVIVWGTMELREDTEAQQMWNQMIRDAFGDEGLIQRTRELKIDGGTCLGILSIDHYRAFGFGT